MPARFPSIRRGHSRPQVTTDLGFLAELSGTWEGVGFNLIGRPDKQGGSPVFLELNQTFETLSFTPISSTIPNRGFAVDDIELFGLTYMKQLIETTEALRVRGIGFRSLTEALDTTTAQGRLVFHMFGALAEFKRSLIRDAQAGLAAARRAGRTGGRPPKLTDEDIEAAKAMLANPDIGVTQIAHRLGVSPATLYRYIPAARTANTPGV